MDARCHCTLKDRGGGTFVKPADGYLEPDPNCERCKGKGTFEVSFMQEFDDDKIVAIWDAVCPDEPEHGASGLHIQYESEKDTDNYLNDSGAVCVVCGKKCVWVKGEEDVF